ncbi:MAG: type II toxin-antitoxin system RelE/ParE family toxin [Spirochaetaceae bacterium]|jgi:mRNA interferase RelE/StbE|nr:type II toxin-antitoxin system RelE/ParE family toxin [Spirochaetaceae bacterium]
MKVTLSAAAKKQFLRINEPAFSRIAAGIDKLKKEPPEGDIKKLQGRNDYRLRVGVYRILFRKETDGIYVTNISTRGGAYKGQR